MYNIIQCITSQCIEQCTIPTKRIGCTQCTANVTTKDQGAIE